MVLPVMISTKSHLKPSCIEIEDQTLYYDTLREQEVSRGVELIQ